MSILPTLNRILGLFLVLLLVSCNQDSDSTNQTASPAKTVDPSTARFQPLATSITGIDFRNDMKEDFTNNILVNSYMYNGGGVAILDVNQDGLQDVYFVSTMGANKLYLNTGNWKFEDITAAANVAALGGFKTGVTVNDINQDGYPDLYVCRTGLQANDNRRNLLYINNQRNGFTEESAKYGLDNISASNHANFFDADGDGDLDMYLLNHPIDFGSVNKADVIVENGKYVRNTKPKTPYDSDRLYRNNGNGTFTDISEASGIVNRAFGLSVTIADFNDDGHPDLFVANDYIEPDIIYINNGKGKFTNQTEKYLRHMSTHTMGVDIADFNNDGLLDIVALDMIAEDNKRQKELMTTMVPDRYETLEKYGYGHQLMRNVLQMNNGNGTFSEVGCLAGISNTDWSWSVLMEDFDNDSYKDIYITNGYRRDVSNLDYLNYTADSIQRTGGLTTQRFKTIYEYLNLIPNGKLRNYMYRNNGNLNFSDESVAWGLSETSFSNGCAYGDLDNDGDMDLVVNNLDQDAFILRNRSQDLHPKNYLQVQLKGPANNSLGVGATVEVKYAGATQFEAATPTRGFFSSSQNMLHFGLGENKMVEELKVVWPDRKVQLLTNVAVNNKITIDYKDASGKAVAKRNPLAQKYFKAVKNNSFAQHVENDFFDFNRERLLPRKLSNLGPALAKGDVNGDGLDDVYLGGAMGFSGQLGIQKSNGSFQKVSTGLWEKEKGHEDLDALFFDADGDDDLDLYVVSGGAAQSINNQVYQDRLYINDGKGQFTKGTLPVLTGSGACVVAEDMDDDGDLDLCIGGRLVPGAYPKAPRSYVLKNDNGKFLDVTEQMAPELRSIGMVSDMIWVDIDGDNAKELIVTGEWMGIHVFELTNGMYKLASKFKSLSDNTGWWNTLHAADMDGDGDMDLIAGNFGMNSRHKPSKNSPIEIFAKDFDRNGALDPIMTWYYDGKRYPIPQRDALIKQLPSMRKKFVRYAKYAEATLEEVFSKQELEGAQHLAVRNLYTSYFENIGNGNFEAKNLPNKVQLSPTYAILTQDYNGDGHQDILIAGNDYGPTTETGRIDSGNGCMLLGDGKGNFNPVRAMESGFWADKEARNMVALKMAGNRQAILVANSNDRLQMFDL